MNKLTWPQTFNTWQTQNKTVETWTNWHDHKLVPQVSGNTVYSSASDGIIKVHQLAEGDQLMCVFVSENLKTSAGEPVITRSIRCLDICADLLLFGDDARNIKILDWKKGLLQYCVCMYVHMISLCFQVILRLIHFVGNLKSDW